MDARARGASLFNEIEALLPLVSKPIQYVGGELNATTKPWDAVDVRWALMYPDAYEVGAPNQGVQILYEVINELPYALAERAYAIWPDLEALMRERGLPQFTVDAHRSIADFDLLGVSFSTELGYTNMLTAIDLAGIPVFARERTIEHPILVAGGHAAFNPEPIADFIDAAVIGDGEEAIIRVTELVQAWKQNGQVGGREGLLLTLARAGVAYVPQFYDVTYLPDGRIQRVAPSHPDVPWRVAKHTLMDLDSWPYPKNPLVPLAETVHERMSVEIFRGCTRGCRFCQAGMITRPVRERSMSSIAEIIDNGLCKTGFAEVGLLSLSSADHSEIAEMSKALADRYEDTQTSLSLPSTRVDAFNIDLANELSRNGRRSGLTFAPEGGSERMRNVINKQVTEEDLIRTVSTAYGAGWRQVKLYFMCGLPTETDDDVLQIAALAREVIKAGRAISGSRDIGKVILEAWRNGARFDGWSEHFSFDRWMAAAQIGLQDEIVDVHWFTTRERLRTEVLPWDHLDSGLSSEWLWEDWQAALAEAEVGDCRWTPCSDCGVCDQLGTDIQVGPTGVTELPMPMLRPSVVG